MDEGTQFVSKITRVINTTTITIRGKRIRIGKKNIKKWENLLIYNTQFVSKVTMVIRTTMIIIRGKKIRIGKMIKKWENSINNNNKERKQNPKRICG